MTVMPSRRLMSRSESITTLALSGSSEAIGSSARITLGCCIRARAMATRCCWPPESVPARCSAVWAMSSRSSAAIAIGALLAGEHAEQVEHGRAVVQPAEQHIGQHVEARHQVELLEDHGAVALPAAQRRALQLGDLGAVKKNRPLGGVDETIDHAQKGRFAGAGAADDADHLALRDSSVTLSTAVFLPKRRETLRISSMALSPFGCFSLWESPLPEHHETAMSVTCQFCYAAQSAADFRRRNRNWSCQME